MKRFLSLILALALFLVVFTACTDDPVTEEMPVSGSATTLYVYNWGEYISDGSEGSLDVNRAFEEYCRKELGRDVSVNYSLYSSNEDLYAKLSSGAVRYDVVVPSDYMVARLASEGLLLEFDPKTEIPHYTYISEDFKGQYYDPQERYSVPYTYGTVGIIYNSDIVDENDPDIGSWSLMWDEDYTGNILQFNNPRDAFGTAQYYKQYSVNTVDEAEWHDALELLKAQKAVLQGYVMDEVFNKLKGNSAAIAPYYAGDYLTMYADNESLNFYHPKEGTNVFVDAMCIPANSQNPDLAKLYIDFMLSEEIAIANAEYICYASPNSLVYENEEYVAYMESEIHPEAIETLYGFDIDTMEYYYDLSEDTRMLMNRLWEELKLESSIGVWIYIICGVIVTAIAAFFIWRAVVQRKRQHYFEKYAKK